MTITWEEIWNKKQADEAILQNKDFQAVYMELKRITGNDAFGTNKGMSFAQLQERFQNFKRELFFSTDKNKQVSVFEVGCGSGANLFSFENLGCRVGGIDYSKSFIAAATKVLRTPVELYYGEAIDLDTEKKYDVVFSNSVFQYFPDEKYAQQVLERMLAKSNNVICVLEVHDNKLRSDFVNYRRATIEDYDNRYKDLHTLFLDKEFFLKFADEHELDIKFVKPNIKGYWNTEFVYDVYMYKRRR